MGLEVAADLEEVECYSCGVDDPGGPEGAVVAPEFTEEASYEYAQTYACIP